MSRLKGVTRARVRAIKRPAQLESQIVSEIGHTIDAVHQSGRQNIDEMVTRRKGILRRRYRRTLRKVGMTGLVGYITRSARRAAFYARFVHDGTSSAEARPFHDLAVAEHDGPHKMRMRRALRKVLK